MPHCSPQINNLEDLYHLIAWISFTTWMYLVLTVWPWRNSFYRHIMDSLGIRFHRLVYMAYMLVLMFFNGCAAWRIYACGNFEHRSLELCFYITSIALLSTVPALLLRFYTITWALLFSLLSWGFSLATLILFAAHDIEATIVMVFTFVTSTAYTLFLAYALYNRTAIYKTWEKNRSEPYATLGDASMEGHMKEKHSTSHGKHHGQVKEEKLLQQ